MKPLRKYNNSSLASSNMVNARREEVARLEKQRLEINRKLERLMKRYSKLTGDRKPAAPRAPIGYAPNDWTPSINASGIKPTMKPWVKVAIVAGAALIAIFLIYSFFVLSKIDPIQEIINFFNRVTEPV